MPEGEFQAEPPDPARRRARQPEDGNRPLPPEGRRPARRPRREDDDYDDYDDTRGAGTDEAVATIIPYRNPLALAAYYCGVFSLIPCVGLALGPTALVLGILGLRASRRNAKAHGMGHAITGIVLGSLTSLANWGIVVAMVVAAVLDRRAVR
jgi:hypothetical protein